MSSSVSVVFIGHVDAGKSTTCGQILIKTAQVDQRLLQKYADLAQKNNRDTWWIAYLMDSSDEERSRGKTVELGSASFSITTTNQLKILPQTVSKKNKTQPTNSGDIPNNKLVKNFIIWDAPGHKNYITNMVSGVFLSDFAVLIISARTGEFEAGFLRGGQTREHAFLAKASGISHLIVAVNKMDLTDWSLARFNFIREKIKSFLKSYGFNSNNVSFIPISGQSGENILERREEKFIESSLLEKFTHLHHQLTGGEDNAAGDEGERKVVLVTVLDNEKDATNLKDIGVKVLEGRVRAGDTVYLPNNLSSFTVESVAPFDLKEGDDSNSVRGSDFIDREGRMTLKVNSSKDNVFIAAKEKLRELDVLSSYDEEFRYPAIVEVKMKVVQIGTEEPLLTKGFVYNLYCLSGMTEVEIVRFVKDGKKQRVAGKGELLVVGVKITGRDVVLGKGRMGRVILREGGNTVGFGMFERVVKFK